MSYRETKLENGLIIATDTMPEVDSVSVGIYAKVGSRYESVVQNGIAHFLEHMAFKGTQTRDAEAIAREIEDVGGYMNAFTSRESTGYYIRVLEEDMPLAVDILGDIMTNSTFDAGELERERGVILQEIGMVNDTPDDAVFETFQELAYEGQALGRSILGTTESVNRFQRHDFEQFMQEHYTAPRMVLAAAGRVEHERFVDEAQAHFAKLRKGDRTDAEGARYIGGAHLDQRDLEQVNLVLGYPGFARESEQETAFGLWASAIGGGMASRLFQEIREKRGLVYTIYSFHSAFNDTGLFGVYAGCGEKDVPELLEVTRSILHEATENMSEAEFNRAKVQLKAGIRMARESTESRMGRIAASHFVFGRYRSMEDILAEIDAATLEKASAAARDVFRAKETLSILGPLDSLPQ